MNDLKLIDHPLAEGAGMEWADEWGEDREFGPYAIIDLSYALHRTIVRQRLRFVPPGRFLMGSGKNESGRYDAEGPAHIVKLTQGFWVAETPCTQAFWTTVMGSNPSRFVDPRRPVERVSWNDVQSFLTRLNEIVPGLQATLPTEAQWEYACRAASATALYPIDGSKGEIEIFGDNNAPALDPLAWYGGNSGVDFELAKGWNSSAWVQKQHPHVRAGTHPVALKTPNKWGLYDMLGNVWEWCDDGLREFSTQDMIDPKGPCFESRCIRGGSWINHARSVRCACRFACHIDGKGNNSGFRFVRIHSRMPARATSGGSTVSLTNE